MSFCNQHKSTDSNPSGKFSKTTAPGVQHFSPVVHQGYRLTVGRRKIGVTVKRVQYSVSIQGPDGRQVRYLDNFASIPAAQAAARDWIDTERYHAKLAKAREQARLIREAKIRDAIFGRASA